jgi:hypothetical protein
MTKQEQIQQWAKQELRKRDPEFVRNLEQKELQQKTEETQKGLEGKIDEVKTEIAPIKEGLEEIKEPTERMAKFLDLLKGDKGEKGETGETGPKGIDGIDGIDGINGINGKDGRLGRAGKDGKDGIDGKNGKDGKSGKDGKDGKSPETAKIIKEVIAKLKTLPENEKLDISHLRNSQQILSAIAKMNKSPEEKKFGKLDMSDQRWHGGGGAGGGAPLEEEPVGDINGVNTAYTITEATTHHIYHNGVRLRSGAGNDYTISGTALTMLWAPESGTLIHEYWI